MPLTFGNEFPNYYFSVPDDERGKRVEKEESLCVVDGEHFFHRGRLTIPIQNYDQELVFNVWTSISESNFRKRNDLWNNTDRLNEEPYFGWLQNLIPTYGNTLNLKTIATENEIGLIPTITMIEEDHQLTLDQKNGISFEKAMSIVDSILTSMHSGNSK